MICIAHRYALSFIVDSDPHKAVACKITMLFTCNSWQVGGLLADLRLYRHTPRYQAAKTLAFGDVAFICMLCMHWLNNSAHTQDFKHLFILKNLAYCDCYSTFWANSQLLSEHVPNLWTCIKNTHLLTVTTNYLIPRCHRPLRYLLITRSNPLLIKISYVLNGYLNALS